MKLYDILPDDKKKEKIVFFFETLPTKAEHPVLKVVKVPFVLVPLTIH
jgi:hypothetical protein